jgi:transposase
MSRFIEGADRQQVTLLPECLDDFIAEDNTVRIVDAFIGELDLAGSGFDGATPAATGRPSYHPSVLLKLYLYGYLNRIQSSRGRSHDGLQPRQPGRAERGRRRGVARRG